MLKVKDRVVRAVRADAGGLLRLGRFAGLSLLHLTRDSALSTEESFRLLPLWSAIIASPRREKVFSSYPPGRVSSLLGAGNISTPLPSRLDGPHQPVITL
jgi:hypothetical protein